MRSFYELTAVEHQNPVGLAHGGQPMSDDDVRPRQIAFMF